MISNHFRHNAGRGTIGQAVLVFLGVGLVIGIASVGALVWQSAVEQSTASVRDAAGALDSLRERLGPKPPYVEVVVRGQEHDTEINHTIEPAEPAPIMSLHGLAWDPSSKRLIRASMPYWAYRLSRVKARLVQRLVGDFDRQLGLDVTLPDLERLGPGLVLDYREPGGRRVIVWAD